MTIVNNLQNKTTYLFLLFFIISCNNQRKVNEIVKIQIPFSESGLKVACTRTIKTLDNEIHGIHYIYKSGKGIDKDSLNNLLFSISQFDDFNDDNCVKYSNNTFESWDKTIKTEKCYNNTSVIFKQRDCLYLGIRHKAFLFFCNSGLNLSLKKFFL